MADSPKYRMVLDYLRDGIASGKYGSHRRLPSEMELVHRFSVSRPTVVRAMQELNRLGLIDRRVGSGTYVRQPAAVSPAGGVLGVIATGLGHTEILDPICSAVARAAAERQFSIFQPDARTTDFSADHARALCAQYIERGVEGVFFAPLELTENRQAVNVAIAESLEQAGIPVVLLDRDIMEFPGRSRFDLVAMDSFQAGYLLAEHLCQLGRQRICFIARPLYPATTNLRIAGCREAILHGGGALPRKWLQIGDPEDRAFVRKMMQDVKPDAIICSNDLTAALLMRSLQDQGVAISSEVAVAGFDDVRYATLLTTPLTTIRQPCELIGRAAVDLMLDLTRNGIRGGARMVLLPGELVIRQSTKG